MRLSRTHIRLTTALGTAALLTATVAGCGATEKLTTGLRVEAAVARLGERPTATLIASVDGSARDASAFLARARGHAPDPQDARLLSRAELTMAVGSGDEDTALREMSRSDAANLAAALNFGGKDVFAVKAIKEKVYLRLNLRALVSQTGGSSEHRANVSALTSLADELPGTLRAARDAIRGRWVEADPQSFDDFARAARVLAERGIRVSAAEEREQAREAARERAREEARRTADREARGTDAAGADADREAGTGGGDSATEPDGTTEPDGRNGAGQDDGRTGDGRPGAGKDGAGEAAEAGAGIGRDAVVKVAGELHEAAALGAALDGQSQRAFLKRLERTIGDHASFRATGKRDGADLVTATLPARAAARGLAPALRPLGADLHPERVADRDITARLAIRRGQLTNLTVDLGQFLPDDRGEKVSLPLRIDVGGGAGLAVEPPGGAKELKPQDLLAAVVYGALGRSDR